MESLKKINNSSTFDRQDIVEEYKIDRDLQRPEIQIIDMFKEQFPDMAMLDIGVGAGRTTFHFAPLVKEYIGIDYSSNMIKACVQQFSELKQKASFKVCDARNLETFKNSYFDFVLFSYNGIDYVSYNDRLRVLSEIRRVGKKGGIFFFSTHNLECVYRLFRLKFNIHPIKMIQELRRQVIIRKINDHYRELNNLPYAIINDGAHEFKLKTYYTKHSFQFTQLENCGFRNIQILNNRRDKWLYYLCNI